MWDKGSDRRDQGSEPQDQGSLAWDQESERKNWDQINVLNIET